MVTKTDIIEQLLQAVWKILNHDNSYEDPEQPWAVEDAERIRSAFKQILNGH